MSNGWAGRDNSWVVQRLVNLVGQHYAIKRPVWTDALFPLAGAKAAGTNDPTFAVWRTPTRAWEFSKTVEQELFFALQLPHGYEEGTDLKPHLHWGVNVTTATGTVTWGLDYTIASPDGSVFPASANLEATYTFAADQQYKHLLTGLGTISGTGLKVSSVLAGRLYRKAGTDTFDDVAFALSADVHHQVDSHGSRQESTK